MNYDTHDLITLALWVFVFISACWMVRLAWKSRKPKPPTFAQLQFCMTEQRKSRQKMREFFNHAFTAGVHVGRTLQEGERQRNLRN